MDHEMSDYLVQRPISESGTTGRGELMYGGGRHVAKGFGVGVSDDSYIDPDVENHLRGLPERLNLTARGSHRPVHLELLASWTGIIGSSFDNFPWVGGVPGHPGIFLAAGYSGHGMPNAPLSGRHVARLVLESLRDGGDWSRLQETEVELTEKKGLSSAIDSDAVEKNFGVPVEYVITRERINKALG
jgi:glycine/D-amino acid oxidase-like deaminating enzyme